MARAALLRLPIPEPVTRVGPDPSVNEWNMAAVGYPLWLWIDGPDPYSHQHTPSPDCGYTYREPSLPDTTYPVTATTHWQVDWSALGQTGTLPFQRTGPATDLPVGELVAVRTR